MSRFDDDLRGAVKPIAREPLPDGVLDEALDAAPARTRWPVAAGAVTAALVLAIAAGIGFGELIPSPLPSASPSAVPSGSSALQPTPSATVSLQTPSPTPAPPTPSPTNSLPPAEPVANTIEAEGIRLTLALDRNRIFFGERTWADVTVENIGADTVYWGHSGTCVYAASVAAFPDVPEEVPYGRSDWPGESGVLKTITVAEGGFMGHGFTPEGWVDFDGNFGCTSDLVTSEVNPGEVLTYRAAWDGEATYGPARAGSYHVDATFNFMSRGAPPATEAGTDEHAVTVSVPMNVDGPNIDYIAPGEAVDRVLENSTFQANLADAPRRDRWVESVLTFGDGNWVLSLYLEGPTEAIVATVDAVSGDVIAVEIDPNPDRPGDG